MAQSVAVSGPVRRIETLPLWSSGVGVVVFVLMSRIVHVGVRVRFAAVRVLVRVFDVVVRVRLVGMRVAHGTVAVLVGVDSVGHATDAGTGRDDVQLLQPSCCFIL